jgi:hypothetical protein
MLLLPSALAERSSSSSCRHQGAQRPAHALRMLLTCTFGPEERSLVKGWPQPITREPEIVKFVFL